MSGWEPLFPDTDLSSQALTRADHVSTEMGRDGPGCKTLPLEDSSMDTHTCGQHHLLLLQKGSSLSPTQCYCGSLSPKVRGSRKFLG